MERIERDGHVLINGEAIEVLQNEIPDDSVDLIFVDPPYNIGKDFNGLKDKWDSDEAYITWCHQWLDLCIKKLKPTGSFYVMTSTQFMPYFDLYLRDKITILSRIVWSYDSSGVQAKKFYGSMYEPILFCVKSKNKYTFNTDAVMVEAKTGAKRKLIDYRKNPPQPYNTKKVVGNVWEFARVRYRMPEYENHPTQKPIELLQRIIEASTNKGDLVLDPFSGSFTTSYVAKSLERKSIGIEINNDFFQIGLRRVGVAETYNGVNLVREPKSFEIKNKGENRTLNLFEE